MKNVLMLTYMYYPANHIASHRPGKMAKYMAQYGWNPIVVCPEWTASNSRYFDPKLSGQGQSQAQVHAIPYAPMQGGGLLTKAWKAVGLLSDPRVFAVRALRRFNRALEKSPPEFYYGAIGFLRDYLRCNRIDCIWATEAVSHAIAARIHREFNIPWVADFRDVFDQKGFSKNAKGKAYLLKLEPSLLETCSMITTVSDPLKEVLETRHRKPVHVVENGFDHADYTEELAQGPEAAPVFHIVYTGKIIYPLRDPSPLFEALSKFIVAGKIDPTKVKVSFYGTEAEGILSELMGRYPGLDGVVDIQGRIAFQEAVRIQRNATVLLHLAHGNERGILTGKVFEYLGARRPVLCIPGDRDCVDALLAQTKAGLSCHDAEAVADTLIHWYHQWLETGAVPYEGIDAEIMKHSRQERARVLARLLEECTGASTGERSTAIDTEQDDCVCHSKSR